MPEARPDELTRDTLVLLARRLFDDVISPDEAAETQYNEPKQAKLP